MPIEVLRASRPDRPIDLRVAPPPLRAGMVTRRRLLQRLLATGATPRLTLIHAPAGYGKTSLLAQWAAADRRDVAWLAVDPAHNDPVRLTEDIARSLEQIGPVDPDIFDSLRAGPAALVPLALPLLGRILRNRPMPYVLILDDVHEISAPESVDVVRVLIAHVAADSQIVLSGRSRPALPLGRMRVAGELAEISTADLRMSAAETTELLRLNGAAVSDEAGTAVAGRTEGWPAAIYLASLVMRESEEHAQPDAIGGELRAIADYFREEVLPGTSADDAEFLMKTAILDRLTAPLCNAVLDRGDSAQHLRALADSDLFVTPLDRRDEWYRVHQLFRESLRAELRHTAPELEPVLHRRASEYYFATGDVESAVRHALHAGDDGRAAELVWLSAPLYETQGRSATLQRLVSTFTRAQIAAHPELALTVGWCRLDAGDGDEAAQWATLADAVAGDRVLAEGSTVAAMTAVLRAAIAEHGIEQVGADAEAAIDGVASDNPVTAVIYMLRGCCVYLTGDRERGRELLVTGERLASSFDAGSPLVFCLTELALIEADDERWKQATALMRRAQTVERRHGLQQYASLAHVSATAALVHAHARDFTIARANARAARRRLALGRRFIPWLEVQTRVVLARALLLLDELADARTLAAEARNLIAHEPGATVLHEQVGRLQESVRAATAGTGDDLSLTTAELRTLQYLPTHLSLREIGERLFITRSTAKTHCARIYSKLDVTSRADAVERARELGLVGHE